MKKFIYLCSCVAIIGFMAGCAQKTGLVTSPETVKEEHMRIASQKMEEDKEVTALKSYPLHEKLLIIAVMKASGLSTGEIFSAYKNLCKAIRQKELTQRRVTQMLGEIEMSGIISGKIIHQGIH